MGRKYQIRDQDKVYFVTFTIVYWIDIFVRDCYKEIFIDSLKYCQQNKGLEVYAYCIMTSHVHLIIRSKGENKLEDIIRDLKSYTSRHIRKEIASNPVESRREWILWMFMKAGKDNIRNNDFQFWQQHNHPIELSTNEMMEQRLEYIHNNPVAAGFVEAPEYWEWSSAKDYFGIGKGRLDLIFIE
jgi:putative transposase